MKKTIYETKISDKRWIAYDIPGNVGWIMYLVVTIIRLKTSVNVLNIIFAIPALIMITGVAELIRERIVKLDRVLAFTALACGFGALTLGGLLGFFCAVYGMLKDFSLLNMLASAGGLLCFVFAGLLLVGYKKKG